MITIDINKAKEIAHDLRRKARAAEFAPLDELIAKQIPGETEAAEAKRAAIRTRYQRIQKDINAAKTVDGLLTIVKEKL